MKKILFFTLPLLIVLLIAGCSTSETSSKSSTENNKKAETNCNGDVTKETEHIQNPQEPQADTLCAFCNMKVYEKSDSFGAFTTQGLTKDGEYVFFDDIGCVLNYERKTNEKLALKWVRDYLTMDWTELDKATPVKTTIETPMKYGYVLFSDSEKAKEFIANEENKTFSPTPANWDEIDKMAYERYQMKMKKEQMQQQTQM